MLLQIEIKNIAIIDYALIDFTEGYHVLTGETGAGKSIILSAIALLSGDRAHKELIRLGQEEASVKGVLMIQPENRKALEECIGPLIDDYVTVERILSKDGKSLAKINGKIEPVKYLREIFSTSIEICGQKSHINLMKEAYYLELVDSISSETFQSILHNYKDTYRLWKKKKEELADWLKNDREQEQMLDLYKYQLNEIEEACLKSDEEDELMAEKKRLTSFEKLSLATNRALEVMEHLQNWNHVTQATEMMAEIDEHLLPLVERAQNIYVEMDDVKFEISKYSDGLEYDEARLNVVMLRDEEIKKIKRKYGNTVEDVLQYYEEIKTKLQQYDQKEEIIVTLTEEVKALEKILEEKSQVLHQERLLMASTLSKEVEKELHDLAMPHAEFELRITPLPIWSENGKDEVQAYFNANKGEEMRPINKIASGGEMARVLLAIKVVVNERTPGKTLIFDEVDEGIGGDVGRIIGQKMHRLGQQVQVIVISHLPQVASKALHHYRIEKTVQGERTYSTIKVLSSEQRIHEIARMLYGEAANEITWEQAKRMLETEE